MKFNEDSRVKIPVILHLTRLGYTYLSLKRLDWDESSNIVPSIFRKSVSSLNPNATPDEIENMLSQLDLLLDNEDLGKQFYEKITQTSGLKIIDFEDFNRNSFNVVTEFTCMKDDEEFRPDITLLINGLPLVFIEVKKPNNRDGILAERNRIVTRFRNPKFKRFINITQLMVFSNNMEYDDGSHEPLEGAFYASTSYDKPVFNYFREEEVLNFAELYSLKTSKRKTSFSPTTTWSASGTRPSSRPTRTLIPQRTDSAPRSSPVIASPSCFALGLPTSEPRTYLKSMSCDTRRYALRISVSSFEGLPSSRMRLASVRR